ncbi:MAG: hypothetical protein QG630_20 [Patescibacteria group bacterium]|nr:hypothetical protein [Patescibacteria group bacterium]
MASLFKNKLIKEELNNFTISDIKNKIYILKKWDEARKSGEIYNISESGAEQSFNQDIFCEVLDYKKFPNSDYTVSVKENTEIKGGQTADAALGFHFNNEKEISVQVVVEIKDANKNLDKPQQRANSETPVQQGFRYKSGFRNVKFVIVTNFLEIRLYRDHQLDYEKFELSDLVDSKDNYFNFRKFYFLMSEENLISKVGESKTEKLLSKIKINQEEITKKFYKEYKDLRLILINDIKDNNENLSFDFIIKKAQKLIDRLVFICFFEDSGLLPENKLSEVIEYAGKQVGLSSWSILKDFFMAVDKGSERLEIPNGYNGELFKQDIELDSLNISDNICEKFVKLSRFNFNEDLSVNILGHIFEQSISDLEKLKAYSESGGEIKKDNIEEKVNKKDSKRKKDGIFYTPEYIVDYIVKNSLGKYLEEKEERILEKHNIESQKIKLDKTYNKKLLECYKEYKEVLQNIKVVDPACGSGAFLVRVYDYLLEENLRVRKIINDAEKQIDKKIGGSLLDNNEIIKTEIKSVLKNNIYGVDLNEESVEITKLSLWLKSAKKGEKLTTLKDNIKCGNSLIDDPLVAGDKAFNWQSSFPEVFVQGGFDVVVGNPPYVRPHNLNTKDKEYFWGNYKSFKAKSDLYAIFMEKGIEILSKNGFLSFITPHTWMYLESFDVIRNMLYENGLNKIIKADKKVFQDAQVDSAIFILNKSDENKNIEISLIDKDGVECFEKSIFIKDILPNKVLSINNIAGGLVEKIESNSVHLSEIVKFNYGLKTADDEKFLTFKPTNDLRYKKLLRRGDFDRYVTEYKNEYVLYDPELMRKNKNTARPGDKERFENIKMIVMDIATKLKATIDEEGYYVKDALLLSTKDKDTMYFYLSILNSKLLNFYYSNKYKVISVAKNAILDLPFPTNIDQKSQQPFVEKADEILKLNKEYHEELKSILDFLKSEFRLEKINNKLEKFYNISFEDFYKSVKTKNIEWGIDKKEEWYKWFSQKQKSILDKKNKIDETDREIDSMVYVLYGLTEEEIKIVENK